jgi:predicted Holliday junction resolvase-like endonuclease
MDILNKIKFKNISILIITVVIILTVITIFSYIQRQNIEYKKQDQELLIKQQQEEDRLKEESIEEKIELPEIQEDGNDLEEPKYRDDSIMVF